MIRNENANSHLTSGRLLARNTLWNLAGQILPMLVGVVTIPVVIREMGVERFGVLSLAWVVVGYFSLFDLGIGRALTKLVADKLGANEEYSIGPVVWTSLLLILGLGAVGTAVTLLISPLLVHRVFKISPAIQEETLQGFYLLAASIPLVTVTAGLRGVLEALQRFRIVNLIRIPVSVWSFAAPLMVLPFSRSVAAVIGVLIVGRLVACVAYLYACFRAMPGLSRFSGDFSHAVPVLKVGGWMTVSNICGPALIYGDRFVISNVLSVSVVSYYTAPFEMISRVIAVSAAVGGVLFPAFAVSMTQEPKRAGLLLERGVKYVFMIVFPVTLFMVVFAPEILRVWLGAEFAQQSAVVLRWLAIGMLMSCLTNISFSSLQGIGRSDIAGKVLLIDLFVYFVVLFLLVKHFGIGGAAAAWAGRTTLELLIFLILNQYFLPKGSLPLRLIACGLIAAFGAFYSITLLHGMAIRIACVALTLVGFSLGSWFFFLGTKERAFVMQISHHPVFSFLRQSASTTVQ